MQSVCRRCSDASAAAAMLSAFSPLKSGWLPTLVATTMSFCSPRSVIHFPMIVSDSPPELPGADAVYESEVSMKFAPASANESRISKDVFSSAVHPKGLPPKLSRKMSRSEFPMIATVWNSRR